MRVVAGTAGGRRLSGPTNEGTRPTTDRTREAIFNSLESMGAVRNADVLDLFAGSGACGIEALSRGAASATFVDTQRAAVDVIKQNLQQTGFSADVVQSDALAFLSRNARFDTAIIDPPYEFDQWEPLLETLDVDVAVLESNRAVDPPSAWSVVRSKRYGDTHVTIIERIPT